jgi:hypothetical protein
MHDDTQGYTGSVQTLPQARMNGAADTADTRGKRIANRTPWLDLPEPYDNLRVRVWLDYPQEIAELLTAPAEETPEQASARMMEFFKGVILQHDGWEMDDDGGPLQAPDTDEFWARIPTPLGRAVGMRFFEEIEAGNSRASRKSRRKSWRKR